METLFLNTPIGCAAASFPAYDHQIGPLTLFFQTLARRNLAGWHLGQLCFPCMYNFNMVNR